MHLTLYRFMKVWKNRLSCSLALFHLLILISCDWLITTTAMPRKKMCFTSKILKFNYSMYRKRLHKNTPLPGKNADLAQHSVPSVSVLQRLPKQHIDLTGL